MPAVQSDAIRPTRQLLLESVCWYQYHFVVVFKVVLVRYAARAIAQCRYASYGTSGIRLAKPIPRDIYSAASLSGIGVDE